MPLPFDAASGSGRLVVAISKPLLAVFSAVVVACGQTTSDVVFACGDAGSTCQSSTQFCSIITTISGVANDGSAPPYTTYDCEPLINGCSTCECLIEAGAAPCHGLPSCNSDNGAVTLRSTCNQ
jgi:hypothetical protein